MLSGLRSRWHDVRSGLWFLPGLVAAAFAAVAVVLVQVDRAAGPSGVEDLFGGSASAARAILSTVAGSVITVAGLAFSITIITLQLVSQQFSPRATRTFLGNRPTQLAAGVFLGVFVYCLIVLRAVREEDFGEFVPGLSVAVAILLGVVGIAVLLFFINDTAQSIKVSSIAARIARETLASIDTLYPEPYGEPVDASVEETVAEWRGAGEPVAVRAPRPGFVQRVDLDLLADRLPREVERVHVRVYPGEFVTEAQALVHAWPGEADAAAVERAVRAGVVVADEREVREDPQYGVEQLADIALRAISPSVNDPATAVTSIAYVAACLERLAGRGFPASRRRFRGDRLEVLAERPRFETFVEHGLEDVGRWAGEARRVVEALLAAAARAAAVASDAGADDRADALLAAAERIAATARDAARLPGDRDAVEGALERVAAAVEERRPESVRLASGGRRVT
ncbi:MAG TPA: DUF2254 domain-containing protein [Gaiellaceae bacterium]|nr:DUF2254 domain-containing protein [Gaiellaceae bacterium]